MVSLRNPLSGVRTTTVGVVGLIASWVAFQIFDENPPPVLDQLLVAIFGVWFAAEAKRNSQVKKKASDEDDTEEE